LSRAGILVDRNLNTFKSLTRGIFTSDRFVCGVVSNCRIIAVFKLAIARLQQPLERTGSEIEGVSIICRRKLAGRKRAVNVDNMI